jgi:4-hydroxybenzoate polyprenyltransferase
MHARPGNLGSYARRLGREATDVTLDGRITLKGIWEEIRPRQWVKNAFVLAPLLFSKNLFAPDPLGRALVAFGIYCLASSVVYLFNDIADIEHDRLHPQKRLRPIASGWLSMRLGAAAAAAIAAVAAAGALALGWPFAATLASFWIINLVYTLRLKHAVILDVFAVSSGFVLRVVAGGLAIDVEISDWLLICTTLLALNLGFSKRRHELRVLAGQAGDHRSVLRDYSPAFLDMMISIVTACTLVSYALYTVSEETVSKFGTRGLLMTSPFVLYGVFRYLFLVYHRSEGGDPTQDLLSDRPSVVNLFLWVGAVAAVLYWP